MAASETVSRTRERLGPTGVWLALLTRLPAEQQREGVRRIEVLGYGSVWGGEVVGNNDIFVQEASWLCGSSTITVGTGIANIWARHPATAQAATAAIGDAWPHRFVLGLGVSHSAIVERTGQAYERPLERMREYLDWMDQAPVKPFHPVPRVLAALRPRMLELARDRADGAHTYFVPTAHTARAREILGPDRLLIPEQAVVVDANPVAARMVARRHTEFYLDLPNYVNNLRHLGFSDEDFQDAGSDRLVDAIVAWGDNDAIAARVREHRDAGADHVLLQPLAPDLDGAISQLEELAIRVLPAPA
ncbi:TIGR03620 family F420-dependent LLM class oxidoreductase [Planosporangium flavigriseum]|uniref:LLM class F420-dependent oxidoreductase n=1 Tax=Planosporangium flavigriseum TaxID=373681 RepID=A0A8J3LYA3_9ACTN|nr:TIGR03620 family F420-dependent LLM class oxidoreductase [Planosporangium flavigriseum]NJC65888.1 TIGR03620 family F420-dependent LLM class oxidoreductase [Planosporangium flavigriseum]GIG75595.1 LLM class F420-dependent oxidoreductase [Planosporangium flavigriseum]